jgi:arylsulfatase
MASWDDIPEDEKPFQRRLMEVAAGFAEHVDVQVGRLADELDRLGYAENTLFLYIWGDNGSSAEGQDGTIAELLAQNGIPTTVRQHIDALDELGGLEVLGSPKVDNQYHAGWGWAGSTPYKGTKLLASHLGGTRNPLAIRWPKKVAPDATPRDQFLHCNDIVPTIYDILGIEAPLVVNGVPQVQMAGASFARTLTDRAAPGGKKTQYFEVMASRAIYHDGWMACAFGPRVPWLTGLPAGIQDWTPDNDRWELYHLDVDWSQAHDLAAEMPEKLAQMRELFAIEAARNQVLPIGGGLWVPVYHPELRIAPPYREWEFSGEITRIPEFCAPALGNKNNTVTIEVDLPTDASGVLYALGGVAGGLTCYLDDGFLCYEYNLFIIARTKIRSTAKLPAGPTSIVVETRYAEQRPAGPLDIVMRAGGDVAAQGRVPVSAPLLFTANDCLDIGVCLGSPVSLDYYERAPFPFEGRIERVRVAYT